MVPPCSWAVWQAWWALLFGWHSILSSNSYLGLRPWGWGGSQPVPKQRPQKAESTLQSKRPEPHTVKEHPVPPTRWFVLVLSCVRGRVQVSERGNPQLTGNVIFIWRAWLWWQLKKIIPEKKSFQVFFFNLIFLSSSIPLTLSSTSTLLPATSTKIKIKISQILYFQFLTLSVSSPETLSYCYFQLPNKNSKTFYLCPLALDPCSFSLTFLLLLFFSPVNNSSCLTNNNFAFVTY